MVLVAQIIVDVPLMQTDRPYSYLVPESMQGQITIGMRIHVPFGKGNRLLQGFVIGFGEQENVRNLPDLKPIAELLDYEPVLNQDQLDLADQMRHTVFSYKISILKSMLPGLLNSQYDKVIMATDKLSEEERDIFLQGRDHILFSQLSKEQGQAIPRLVGSGRVTVDYIARDKQNIKTEKHYSVQRGILETLDISQRAKKRLTPQMTNRFISRFGDLVAIMHSGLSDGEKFDEWRKVRSGQAKVVVGARSAIFAPLDNIGAIIIDEEHEATYKQESNPRYHARDVALLRSKSHGAILVLGSATPSIESRARAQKGVYHFLSEL